MTLRPVDPSRFRAVMGNFATGVAVVTAAGPAGPVGLTANAVCSVSLEPLLLLVCFDDGARTLRVVRATVVSASTCWRGQEAIARRFASKLPEAEKFAGVPHTVHDGIPVLEDAVAWVGCELAELVRRRSHHRHRRRRGRRGRVARAAAHVVPRRLRAP